MGLSRRVGNGQGLGATEPQHADWLTDRLEALMPSTARFLGLMAGPTSPHPA